MTKLIKKAVLVVVLGGVGQFSQVETALAQSSHCEECRSDCPNYPNLYCGAFACSQQNPSCGDYPTSGCSGTEHYKLKCFNKSGDEE